jgi:1-acyl-sn-glycerol-3-phosphate acyltransferase
MKIWHRLEVQGRENLPADGSFVLVGNHSSYLDTPALGVALPARLSHFFTLAAEDHFFTKVFSARFAVLTANALPMPRDGKGKGRAALNFLRRRLLEDDMGLIFFPEGTRSRTGEMGRFRCGIGTLVAGTNIPVVPCYIEGSFEALSATSKFSRPKKIRITVGKPITFADAVADADGCTHVSKTLEDAVRALSCEPKNH